MIIPDRCKQHQRNTNRRQKIHRCKPNQTPMGNTYRHWCHQLTAVNGETINIYGIKQVTLVYKNFAIPTTFIISDVNCAILGLDAITRNGLQLTVNGYDGHLAHEHAEVRLHYIGNRFYLKATVCDGLYNYVDYTPDFTSWYYSWYDEYDTNNKVYGLLQDDAQPLPVTLSNQSTATASWENHRNKKQTYLEHSKNQRHLHRVK
eukprot:5898565-Amphidinium_carterae.3